MGNNELESSAQSISGDEDAPFNPCRFNFVRPDDRCHPSSLLLRMFSSWDVIPYRLLRPHLPKGAEVTLIRTRGASCDVKTNCVVSEIRSFPPHASVIRLSNAAMLETTTGQIVNLLSNDGTY